MSDAEERIRRGRAAAEEWQSMKGAVAEVRTQLLDQIERSDPKDTAEREAAYFELRALAAVIRRMHAHMAEGQLEESKTA